MGCTVGNYNGITIWVVLSAIITVITIWVVLSAIITVITIWVVLILLIEVINHEHD